MNINHATYACHPDAKRKDLRLPFCYAPLRTSALPVLRPYETKSSNSLQWINAHCLDTSLTLPAHLRDKAQKREGARIQSCRNSPTMKRASAPESAIVKFPYCRLTGHLPKTLIAFNSSTSVIA